MLQIKGFSMDMKDFQKAIYIYADINIYTDNRFIYAVLLIVD
jgi:hypothetical protein